MKNSFLYLFVIIVIFGCKKGPALLNTDENSKRNEIQYYYIDPGILTFDHADSVEAQFMDIWWTNNLRPNSDTSNLFMQELGAIRYLVRDSSINLNNVRFKTYWKYSEINIKFDSIYTHLVYDSAYFEWNIFDEELRPVQIISHNLFGETYFSLYFAGVLNPSILVDLYEVLPGVESCFRTILGSININLMPVNPYKKNSTHTYLIVPYIDLAGSIFYYFEAKGTRIGLIGCWDQRVAGEYPYWWEEGLVNIDFMNYRE